MISLIIRKAHKTFNFYDAMTGMSEIIRRTFVNNSFDGALTMLGVLLGSFVGGIHNPTLVIKLGLATSIAVGISGLTGALFAESAERKKQIKEMEEALHRDLENTEYKKAHDTATVLTALMDGFSPFIASIIILMPFFFIGGGDIILAYQASVVLSIMVFFFIGAFLAKTSGESMLMMGLKLIAAGVICMGAIMLLEGIN